MESFRTLTHHWSLPYRRLGDVAPGDTVDGATVLVAELLPYPSGTTFDLLPSGATGIYWADAIRLASTIRR